MLQELKHFTENGQTLVISGIGQRGIREAEEFLGNLKTSGGLEEVLGLSLPGVSIEARERVQKAFIAKPEKSPWWKTLFGRPAARVFVAPPVAVNDTSSAIEQFLTESKKFGGTARVALHFISYERGNGKTIETVIRDFKEGMPDLLHIGVVTVNSGSIIDKMGFDKETANYPPDSLGIPVILMDKDAKQDHISREWLSGEKALLVGLAGLVANKRAFPKLSRYNYVQILRSLFDQSNMLGVSVGQHTIYPEYMVRRASYFDEGELVCATRYALGRSFELDKYSYTSLPRNPQANLDVVIVQLPIPPNHKFWKDPLFTEVLNCDQEREERDSKSILSIGHTEIPSYKSIETGNMELLPIVATRLFAVRKIPGWHLIMGLLEDL